jgi:hypothetical protein
VRKYGERFSMFDVNFRAVHAIDRRDGIVTILLDMLVHDTTTDEEGEVVGTGPQATVYSVDRTGILRAKADTPTYDDEPIEEQAPAPFDVGALVVCF